MNDSLATREKQTSTVGSGTATVTYDVHEGVDETDRPALFILGGPMEAFAFGTLAGYLTDRTVITYDPRGAGRNPTDTAALTPQDHAADIHAVIAAFRRDGAGPIDVFATSGGAVNVLTLLARDVSDVRRVVAHEPPFAALLPDRDHLLAAAADIRATYDAAGHGPAMAKFIGLVMQDGPLDATYADRPAPDPTDFGMTSDDDGTRTDALMRNLPAAVAQHPDLEALAALGDRLVIAAGAKSQDEFAVRGGCSIAAALGREAVEFPGDHAGFVGGEYGQMGEPAAFAAKLREVLDA